MLLWGMWTRKWVKQCWRVWNAKMNTEACGGTTTGSKCLPRDWVIKTQKLGRRTSWAGRQSLKVGDFAWQMVTIRLLCRDPSWQALVTQTLGRGAHQPWGNQTCFNITMVSAGLWMAGCKLQTRGQLLLEPGSAKWDVGRSSGRCR